MSDFKYFGDRAVAYSLDSGTLQVKTSGRSLTPEDVITALHESGTEYDQEKVNNTLEALWNNETHDGPITAISFPVKLKNMTPEERFLAENFKAGEYSMLTILVKNTDLARFVDHMKAANLTLAIMPRAQAGIDFADPSKTGTPQ